MRILMITAGAANMYCGSCLRDNALATELLRRGHDIVLLPLYTPTRTDETNVSQPRVFFGGVSVYLQQHVPFLRRSPALLDWLWDRPALIRAVAGRSVKTDPRMLGDLTVSMLEGEAGHQAKEIEKLLTWLRGEPPFDVIVLPNALLISLAGPLGRATGRPVLCTLQGEDLFLEGLEQNARRSALALIRGHVADVARFVAVSGYYARFMTEYLDLPPSQVDVVPIGITLDGFAPRTKMTGQPFTVGYLARIDPAKGLDRLCAIYRRMRQELGLPPSRLRAAGYLGNEHRGYLEACAHRMREWGLEAEFTYLGELDRQQKIDFLGGLDVLSVPTPYAEPKGIFVLEAMARGVPVVQPRRGAFPEILDRTGGGLLVDDSDEAVAEGLMRVWREPALAMTLGRRGAEGVRNAFSVASMADRALEVYRRAAGFEASQNPKAASA